MKHLHHAKGGIAALMLLAAGASAHGPAAADPHAQHRLMAQAPVRTLAEYRVAHLPLVRADGKRVSLDDELDHDGPIALDFVFTSCTAICPVLSQTFAQLQASAAPGMRLRLLSISIDPLQDTPAVLREYGKKFGAGKDWRFYTGSAAESIAVQRAFDVYRGNKMNHLPLVLLRRGAHQPWIRIEGYAGAEALLRELAPAGKNTLDPVAKIPSLMQGHADSRAIKSSQLPVRLARQAN